MAPLRYHIGGIGQSAPSKNDCIIVSKYNSFRI